MRAHALMMPQARAVWSSQLRCAHDCASALAHALGAPHHVSTALRELHFGRWELLRWDQIERDFPQDYALYLAAWQTHALPGGESWQTLRARITGWWEAIARDDAADAEGTDALAIVAHQSALRALRAALLGLSDVSATTTRWEHGQARGLVREARGRWRDAP